MESTHSKGIYKALLKYGYINFSLEILEYCDPSELLKREKYYIDFLLPEYNLSKVPGSPFLGMKHSGKSRAYLSDLNKGEKNPMYGKARSKEAGKPAHKIKVFDKDTNKYYVFDSVSAAAKALNIRQTSISRFIAINQHKPFRNIFFYKN